MLNTIRTPVRAATVVLACSLWFTVSVTWPAQAYDTCTRATPGASDYCQSDKCGVCYEGEGDCDPGQCGPGLTCVEEGAVDRCRVAECAAQPGASDYCASAQCGPCLEGEGDCDPGQCGSGLTCVEEGSVDRCRKSTTTGECDAVPGASDYCASSQCGPCGDGEGDCDAGQCASGFECMEEGAVDRCRPVAPCGVAPDTMDYCEEWACGPCGDGEGHCEAGDCAVGYECREEGTVDRCRPITSDCSAAPGSGNYCGPDQCGPCTIGQGDCDAGQCGPGLECMEQGEVDTCRPVVNGIFEVYHSGAWKPLACVNGVPMIVASSAPWRMVDRKLGDNTALLWLNCPEGGPTSCRCDAWGENMHGIYGWEVSASIRRSGGGPMYPDHLTKTCVVVDSGGRLDTIYTNTSCPSFRLR